MLRVTIISLSLFFYLSASASAGDVILADVNAIHGSKTGTFEGAFGADFQSLQSYISQATEFSIKNMHAPRAYRLFYKGRANCVTPGSIEVNEADNLIGSLPLATIHWVFFSAQNEIIDSREFIRNKRVGIPYDPEGMQKILPEGNHTYIVNHDNFRLANQLYSGRIEAMIMVWEEYIELTKVNPEFRSFKNKKSEPLYVQKLGVICHDTPRNRRIIKAVNDYIVEALDLPASNIN